MFDGNDSNVDENEYPGEGSGWNISLSGIDYSSGDANIQFHVGDGQPFDDPVWGNDDDLIANGTVLDGDGDVFDGDTIAGGNNTDPFLQLWDIRDFSVTSLLAPGLNTLDISTGWANDCLSCVLIAIDLPSGAAPGIDHGVPEPATLALMGLGLAGVGFQCRRGKKH